LAGRRLPKFTKISRDWREIAQGQEFFFAGYPPLAQRSAEAEVVL
jgi:hypothetical protein